MFIFVIIYIINNIWGFKNKCIKHENKAKRKNWYHWLNIDDTYDLTYLFVKAWTIIIIWC